MEIILNGEKKTIDAPMTIEALIERFGFDKSVGAVALNMTFVPSDKYEETYVNDGDEIEVLAPVCGG